MQRDVLGKSELESIRLNLDCAVPGLMTTRCCGTGTCENQPHPGCDVPGNFRIICFLADRNDAQSITQRYGYLRT